MIKICAITTIDKTLSAFVIDSMRALKEKENVDITLVSSMSPVFYEKYKDEFHCINLSMSRGVSIRDVIKSTYALYKLFKKEKFDLVQYATPNASLYASIASCLNGIKTRLYCQWGIRYVGFNGRKRWIFKQLEKLTCHLSTHICSASQKNLDFAVSEGLYKPNKANIIGNGGTIGVDKKEYDISKKTLWKEEVLKEYPGLEGKTVFGFVGRMDRDKGVNELFEAFLALLETNRQIALLMIGPMDKAEGINTILLQRVKDSKNVIFTGFTNEVPKYMAAMDILVHPSYREGFSMVIQQAMFMGVSILTTDIPGPSEIIEDEKSGLLVPAKSSELLLKKMDLLVTNQSMRGNIAIAGYDRALSLFNRERMIKLTIVHRMGIINK